MLTESRSRVPSRLYGGQGTAETRDTLAGSCVTPWIYFPGKAAKVPLAAFVLFRSKKGLVL